MTKTYSFPMSMGRQFRGTRTNLVKLIRALDASVEASYARLSAKKLSNDDVSSHVEWQIRLEQMISHADDYAEAVALLSHIDAMEA